MKRNLFPTLPQTPAYRYVREADCLPRIGASEHAPMKLRVKLFTPDSNWTWYIAEHMEDGPEGDPDLCYGIVDGFEREVGYFSLAELRETRGPMGLPVERDLHFIPCGREDLPDFA